MQILDDCIFCGVCANQCPEGAIYEGEDRYHIDEDKCINCGICETVCPLTNIVSD